MIIGATYQVRKLSHPQVPKFPAAKACITESACYAEPHLLWPGHQWPGFDLGTQWVTLEKTGVTPAPGSCPPGFHYKGATC